jgi:hypothetical protein
MRTVVVAILGFGVSACAPGVVNLPHDQDLDGLLSDLEVTLGTDPFSSDSDEDGFSDGEEYDVGTDPTDDSSRPYLGGWPISAGPSMRDGCADDIEGTGYDEGQIAPDFNLVDQFGDVVRLYDFCDHTVLLASVAFW